jgi:hypothetical protein
MGMKTVLVQMLLKLLQLHTAAAAHTTLLQASLEKNPPYYMLVPLTRSCGAAAAAGATT